MSGQPVGLGMQGMHPPPPPPPPPAGAYPGPQQQQRPVQVINPFEEPGRPMPHGFNVQNRQNIPLRTQQTAPSGPTYRSFTLRKIPASNLAHGEKPSWQLITKAESHMPEDELMKQVKKSKSKKTVKDQLSALRTDNIRRQVEQLAEEQNDHEANPNTKWELASVEQELRTIGRGANEVSAVHVILKKQDLTERFKDASIKGKGLTGEIVDLRSHPTGRDPRSDPLLHQGQRPMHMPAQPGPPLPQQRQQPVWQNPGPIVPPPPPPPVGPMYGQDPGPPGPFPGNPQGPPPPPGFNPNNPSMRHPGAQNQPNFLPNQNRPVPPQRMPQPPAVVEDSEWDSDSDSDSSAIVEVIEQKPKKATAAKAKPAKKSTQIPPPPMGHHAQQAPKKSPQQQTRASVQQKSYPKDIPRAQTPSRRASIREYIRETSIPISDDSSEDDRRRWRNSGRNSGQWSSSSSNPRYTPPSSPGSSTAGFRRDSFYESRRDGYVRQDPRYPKPDRRYSETRVDIRPNVAYRSSGMPIERRGSQRNYDPVIHQRYNDYPSEPAGRRYSNSQRLPPLPDPEVDYPTSRYDRDEFDRRREYEELKLAAAERHDRQRRDRRIEDANRFETARERDYRIKELAREEFERDQARLGRGGGRREYVDEYVRRW